MSVSDEPILGIDLGTTHSLVGVMQAERPVLIPNPLGSVLTPSAVAMRDGEVLVGEAARDVAALHPQRGALAFKRDMGTDKVHTLAGRRFSPPQLSALVLGQLVQDAASYLGREIRRAVLTVPAYFDDLQRQATHDAGRIAGLEVVRLLNEPTAAAMAYGLHQLSRELKTVVLDLGGGTFDVTVLEILEGVIEVRSSAGDTRLGGNDFTNAVEGLLRDRVGDQLGASPAEDRRVTNRLWSAAESAKRRLSSEATASVALVDLPLDNGRTRDFHVELGRDEVEEAWHPIIQRLGEPIRRALADGGVAASDIDEVLLVGGATRMPVVRRVAAEVFGRPPIPHVAVDEVVAQGATLQAGLHVGEAALEDLVVTDVAPFTLGVDTAEEVGGRHVAGLFSPILERGTVIPASRVRVFGTVHPEQPGLEVRVYQGEHPLCEDNRMIGEVRVENLPPATRGSHRVDIRFTYDLNGLLEVEVTLPDLGRRESTVLQNEPGRMSPREVEVARRAMEKLKFHPRDSLPNTAAIARAEALFLELRGEARRELGNAIHHFRALLDFAEDGEKIRAARESLLALIAVLR